MAPSYAWGSIASKLQKLYEKTVYFQFPGLPETHLIDLGGVKG